jgi:hypothetical protein
MPWNLFVRRFRDPFQVTGLIDNFKRLQSISSGNSCPFGVSHCVSNSSRFSTIDLVLQKHARSSVAIERWGTVSKQMKKGKESQICDSLELVVHVRRGSPIRSCFNSLSHSSIRIGIHGIIVRGRAQAAN